MTTGTGFRGGVMALFPLLLWLQSCGSSNDDDEGASAACRAHCDDLCGAIDACNLPDRSPSCAADCGSALRIADCSDATPPSQYTCEELGGIARCASHCAALCAQAVECGAFDQALCVEGCAVTQPVICNPASVAARTCDQLKPEARWYQDVGESLHTDSEVVGGFLSPAAFGLCEDSDDCEDGLACLLASNTCGSCTTDGECERGFGTQSYLCTSGACLAVQCRTSDDCTLFSAPVCDPRSFTCVGCLGDQDCSAASTAQFYPACNLQTSRCVECTSDAHCTSSTSFTRCDLARSTCVQCLSGIDCPPSLPTCSENGLCGF